MPKLTYASVINALEIGQKHGRTHASKQSNHFYCCFLMYMQLICVVVYCTVLRKLIVFGFREVNQSTEAMHFLHSTVHYIDRFIAASML